MSESDSSLKQHLQPLLETKRILITIGSGGVGKTTTAAALGLAAAHLQWRTLVMTIDPARRLATSLGLAELDNEEREVPGEKLQAAGLAPGVLYAMMLDQKRTFDDLVQRFSPDAQTVQQLMRSRIYQQLSSRLAGSQEYAAMEKLHAIWKGERYHLLLLDTPPTANALDFLESPQKMVDAVDSPAVKLFINAYRSAGRVSFNLLGFGAAYVIRRLARFTGGGFLDDIAAFLTDLSGLLGGLRDRAAEVMALLSRPEVGFIVVTSPDPRSIDEAIAFHDQLRDSELAPAAFVINMVHQPRPDEPSLEQVAALVAELGQVSPEQAAAFGQLLHASSARLRGLAQAHATQIERLRAHCGDEPLYVQVPFFDDDIYDIGGLLQIARALAPGAF